MTRPEDAVDEARRAAESARARGAYASDEASDAGIAPERPGFELLREWSLIAVDPSLVYSTRRGGAPITGFKRALLRLMRQYTTELESQQTRFNAGVVAQLEELESRIAALEAERRRDG